MASGDGLQPTEVIVTIGAADAAVGAGTTFTTLLTNFSQSGGERDVESVPLFGGANLTRELPRSQIEVSFDAIIQYGSNALLFDQLVMSSVLNGTTAVLSSGEPTAKTIYLEWTDGTLFYTRAYNNATGVTFDPEMAADDFAKGTVTFKLSPTDSAAVKNLQIAAAAASTLSW